MPNVEFVADGSKGYSSELVSLVVRSHNGRGIARHQALTANYGVSFDFVAADAFVDETGERSKKFRGALDAVFAAAAAAKADSPQKLQTPKPDAKSSEKPETPEKPQKPEKPTGKPTEKPEEKPDTVCTECCLSCGDLSNCLLGWRIQQIVNYDIFSTFQDCKTLFFLVVPFQYS